MIGLKALTADICDRCQQYDEDCECTCRCGACESCHASETTTQRFYVFRFEDEAMPPITEVTGIRVRLDRRAE